MKRRTSVRATKAQKPRWWQLYVMLPLLTGLYIPEMRMHLSSTGHIIAQLSILALIYAFLQIWLNANRSALANMDEERGEWRVKIYQFPADPEASDTASEPLFEMPKSGLKGVLSTTFELDQTMYEDAGAQAVTFDSSKLHDLARED